MYIVNIAKISKQWPQGVFWGRMELSSQFLEEAKEQAREIAERFGPEYNVTMTKKVTVSESIDID